VGEGIVSAVPLRWARGCLLEQALPTVVGEGAVYGLEVGEGFQDSRKILGQLRDPKGWETA